MRLVTDFSHLNVSLSSVTIVVKLPFWKFANGIIADLILAVLDKHGTFQ